MGWGGGWGGQLGQFTDLSEGGGLCKKGWGGVFEKGINTPLPTMVSVQFLKHNKYMFF